MCAHPELLPECFYRCGTVKIPMFHGWTFPFIFFLLQIVGVCLMLPFFFAMQFLTHMICLSLTLYPPYHPASGCNFRSVSLLLSITVGIAASHDFHIGTSIRLNIVFPKQPIDVQHPFITTKLYLVPLDWRIKYRLPATHVATFQIRLLSKLVLTLLHTTSPHRSPVLSISSDQEELASLTAGPLLASTAAASPTRHAPVASVVPLPLQSLALVVISSTPILALAVPSSRRYHALAILVDLLFETIHDLDDLASRRVQTLAAP